MSTTTNKDSLKILGVKTCIDKQRDNDDSSSLEAPTRPSLKTKRRKTNNSHPPAAHADLTTAKIASPRHVTANNVSPSPPTSFPPVIAVKPSKDNVQSLINASLTAEKILEMSSTACILPKHLTVKADLEVLDPIISRDAYERELKDSASLPTSTSKKGILVTKYHDLDILGRKTLVYGDRQDPDVWEQASELLLGAASVRKTAGNTIIGVKRKRDGRPKQHEKAFHFALRMGQTCDRESKRLKQ